VRWYPGIGTIHFFARRKDLIERLNRMVGARRAWLPEDPYREAHPQYAGFWDQFETAERMDTVFRKAVTEFERSGPRDYGWNGALACIAGYRPNGEEGEAMLEKVTAKIDAVSKEVQASFGIDVDTLIGCEAPMQLLLAA
jgi:hypothetical protein